MHSPVWLNYDPSLETTSLPSDWEYYSDDYWDQDSPAKRKRKACDTRAPYGTGEAGEEGPGRKRGKPKLIGQVPELSLGASTVIWKSKSEALQTSGGPIVSEGQSEKVSLLKDWRERFKMPNMADSQSPKPRSMNGKGSQRALAVVIGRPSSENKLNNAKPPLSLAFSQGLPSRRKAPRSCKRDTSTRLNSSIPNSSLQDVCTPEYDVTQNANEPKSDSHKRKAPDLLDPGIIKPRPNGLERRKRRAPGKTKDQDPVEPSTESTAVAESENAQANGTVSTSQKRQAEESEDELAGPPPKRIDATKQGGKDAKAETSMETRIRRSTRRKHECENWKVAP